MKKYFLILNFILLFQFCFAQQQFPQVENLIAKVLNNATVRIDLTISSSVQLINGFEIQRSEDSAFGYISVYTYFGTVGGNTNLSFFYEDYPPDPTKIYYYKVRFSNGNQSKIIKVNMGEVFGEYKIIPHPLIDFSRLEFVYAFGQQWILEIADPKGYFIYRDEYVKTGSYPITRSLFNSNGIYFFRIYLSDGSKLITGKIVAM
jgi:hypothetical protein